MRIWIYLWIVVLGAGLLAVRSCHKSRVKQAQLDPRTWTKLLAEIRDGDPHPVHDRRWYVWDEACFIRPKSNIVIDHRIGPVGGGKEVPYQIRHVEHGLLHSTPLPVEIGGPVVLFVGDSHMYGFTDIRFNASTLVEAQVREARYPSAVVLNASCPYTNPYQYAKRMEALWDKLTPSPRVVVMAVFMGNDFVELDDVMRPFLDDALVPQSLSLAPPAETTSMRRMFYNTAKPRLFGELFWQGINQAIYLHQHPERYPIVLAKAHRAVDLLRADCEKNNAKLIVVLIPTYSDVVDFDLPFADHAQMGPIVRAEISRKLRKDFSRTVSELGLPVVDLLPVFQEAGVEDIYAGDFHIWRKGHELLADAVLPKVQRALDNTD